MHDEKRPDTLVHVIAGQHREHSVKQRRCDALHRRSVPSRAPSEHNVVAAFSSIEQPRNVLGRILEVAIHHDGPFALGEIKTGADCLMLTEVATQQDAGHVVGRGREVRTTGQEPSGLPSSTNDLVKPSNCAKSRRQTLEQLGQHPFCTIDGNHHRDVWTLSSSARSSRGCTGLFSPKLGSCSRDRGCLVFAVSIVPQHSICQGARADPFPSPRRS